MKQLSLLLFFTLFTGLLAQSQTPYPLTFFWQGEIGEDQKFEVMISMIDSDKALNGEGSRLRGQLVMKDNWEHYTVRGQSGQYSILFNCYNSSGKMCYSFEFLDANGKNPEHRGRWTDGKKELEVVMRGQTVKQISRVQRNSFAEGVNYRAGRIDAPMLEGLAHPILEKQGEGYRMRDSAFARVAHYGQTYICFRDSLDGQVRQLDWLLLRSSSNYLLESQQIWQDGQIQGLALAAWSYRAGKWQRVNTDIFPPSYLKEGQLQIPEKLQEFIACSDHLIFKFEDPSKTIIWYWNGRQWIEKS